MLAGREAGGDRRAAERRKALRGPFVARLAACFVAFLAGVFLPAAVRPAALPAFFRAAVFFAIGPRVVDEDADASTRSWSGGWFGFRVLWRSGRGAAW
jgi:hypothetical protein